MDVARVLHFPSAEFHYFIYLSSAEFHQSPNFPSAEFYYSLHLSSAEFSHSPHHSSVDNKIYKEKYF